mgnify:FL=1|tara:strand:- start:403 stop:1035 length:633 start_codon:yes stop_codon:yes gene_type:complete
MNEAYQREERIEQRANEQWALIERVLPKKYIGRYDGYMTEAHHSTTKEELSFASFYILLSVIWIGLSLYLPTFGMILALLIMVFIGLLGGSIYMMEFGLRALIIFAIATLIVTGISYFYPQQVQPTVRINLVAVFATAITSLIYVMRALIFKFMRSNHAARIPNILVSLDNVDGLHANVKKELTSTLEKGGRVDKPLVIYWIRDVEKGAI